MQANQTINEPQSARILDLEDQKIEFTLEHGFKVMVSGSPVFYRDVELREPVVNDLIEAEKVASAESPIAFNSVLMGRQIVKIGKHQGPLTLHEIGTLKHRDYAIIQDKQRELERLGEPK